MADLSVPLLLSESFGCFDPCSSSEALAVQEGSAQQLVRSQSPMKRALGAVLIEDQPQNELVIRIQPDEAIYYRTAQAKARERHESLKDQ